MLIFVEIFVVLLIAYSIWGWTLFFMQPSFLYKPLRQVSYTPGELGLDYEKVTFNTDDGLRLSGWYVPGKKSDDSGLTLLFCHGNGGNIMHRLDSINIFYDLGVNCFIFDYRGYGNSEGTPTEEGTYLDAKAAYEWLINEKEEQPDNIIAFGRSLGGAIAAQLASKYEVGSLVIESGFTSYVDMGRKFYPYMPVRLFARYNYNTLDYIKQVRCPVMMIHSRNDEIIPFEFSLKLYGAANDQKELVEIFGSHNDGFLVSNEIYKKAWKKWLEFVKSYQNQSQQQEAS